MDSALECLTFAINALGFGVNPDVFLDITSARRLRIISPLNVLGSENVKALSGYGIVYPSVQQLWRSKETLLKVIFDQHAASKHRKTAFRGGTLRSDPPEGFYQELGIGDDPSARAGYCPMETILLHPQPKQPFCLGSEPDLAEWPLLEDVAPEFCDLVSESGIRLLHDAKSNIKLKETEFRKR